MKIIKRLNRNEMRYEMQSDGFTRLSVEHFISNISAEDDLGIIKEVELDCTGSYATESEIYRAVNSNYALLAGKSRKIREAKKLKIEEKINLLLEEKL